MSDLSVGGSKPARRRFKIFWPTLAGATLRDRLVACAGATVGIGLTGFVSSLALGHGLSLIPLIAAPLGASAVLVFAVPVSPLSQPWPLIAGNTISALSGIAVMQVVHNTMLAAGLAVGLALLLMSLTRSLHPPGGGVALTAVVGGPLVSAAGFTFAFAPVCLNSALLALCAWAFHKFSSHSYPHKAQALAGGERQRLRSEDIDAALSDLGETFDIDRDDLDRLLARAEFHAQDRVRR